MKEIPLFFNISNFLSEEDWNTVEEILKSPGWYYGVGSWGGHFYYYSEDNKVKYIMPLPNTAIFLHGHVVHSWLPYLNMYDQRVSVSLSLIPKEQK